MTSKKSKPVKTDVKAIIRRIKARRTFYSLYMEMTYNGVTRDNGFPAGLCGAINNYMSQKRSDNFSKRMAPSSRNEGILKRQKKNNAYWGSDDATSKAGELTDLRQNLILLYACSIGERIPTYIPDDPDSLDASYPGYCKRTDGKTCETGRDCVFHGFHCID